MDKTAYWIKEEKEPLIEIFTCSSCNDEWKIDSNDEESVNVNVEKCFKYCPNCGAKILGVKMKEGE